MKNIGVPRTGYIISRRKLLNVEKNRDRSILEATWTRGNYTDRIECRSARSKNQFTVEHIRRNIIERVGDGCSHASHELIIVSQHFSNDDSINRYVESLRESCLQKLAESIPSDNARTCARV